MSDGPPNVGDLDKLRPLLRDFVASFPNHAAIILQILELIGDPAEKREARHRMRSMVLDSAGTEAAYSFYEGSLLRSALWDHLRAYATDENAARRILGLRSRVGVNI